ncbi:ribose ABC transport system, high affinity permease rbsD [Vibrio ishigakensis]|uniref:D-ribose pyranase n=1 Tax=Vibrio ishigakensis TaxID=1481914 RepID=A0A0B8NK40_9VIBR|nr:ribose ABC transport system, high affinity permease rbsD [Vibrio ishigakensis]
MKKSTLINSEISYLVATLGHTDEITVCDAGLPIPDEVQRIDLALTHGVPSFIDTVKVILTESQIEGVVIAEEFKTVSQSFMMHCLMSLILKSHAVASRLAFSMCLMRSSRRRHVRAVL